MTPDTLHLANCFEFFKTLDDNEVDYIFTSPPYNRKRNDKYDLFNDNSSDYYETLHTLFLESLRVARKTAFINIMRSYYNSVEVCQIIGEFAASISEIFIWHKKNPLPTGGGAINNAYEFVIAIGERPKSNNTYTKNHLTTSVARPIGGHRPVMKTEVAEFFIENFTQQGELIYDPFMGTGTTALVCKKLGRRYLGTEIIPEYHAVSIDRVHQVQQALFR